MTFEEFLKTRDIVEAGSIRVSDLKAAWDEATRQSDLYIADLKEIHEIDIHALIAEVNLIEELEKEIAELKSADTDLATSAYMCGASDARDVRRQTIEECIEILQNWEYNTDDPGTEFYDQIVNELRRMK